MKKTVDEVRYSKSASKYIQSQTPKEKQRLKTIIDTNLKTIPATGDIKKLKGYSDGRMRFRVGGVRIIFRYDEEGNLLILSVLDIGNRGDIYK